MEEFNEKVYVDYRQYKMNKIDKIVGFSIGFVFGFVGIYALFGVITISIGISIIVGFISIKLYGGFMFRKMQKELLLQFKDFLDSISASYGSGRNTVLAFSDAYKDICQLYSRDSYMAREVFIICQGIRNGQAVEKLIEDFAIRSGLEDISSFSKVLKISNKNGGNLKEIISNSRGIITDKIDIEMEIKATIAQKKLELYTMLIMPFIVIVALRGMGDNTFFELSFVNIVIKIFVMLVIGISYLLGKKIVNIKV